MRVWVEREECVPKRKLLCVSVASSFYLCLENVGSFLEVRVISFSISNGNGMGHKNGIILYFIIALIG